MGIVIDPLLVTVACGMFLAYCRAGNASWQMGTGEGFA